ncbi:MAG: T9SS type A sorting domain-containing protein [Flavobacteriaceae bacterium]
MKKIFVLALFFFSLDGIAQDPRLFDNEWSLTELIVNGNSINIPNSSEINTVDLIFEGNPNSLYSLACNSIRTDITSFSNSSFIIDNWYMLFYECYLQSTFDFEVSYFEDFFRFLENNVPFTYSLEELPNDAIRLTITNNNGDVAIYGNPALAIESSFLNNNFIFYPNPVDDFLKITTPPASLHYKIYSLSGKQLKQGDYPETGIDTSSFAPGIYFLAVILDKGSIFIKFIKN